MHAGGFAKALAAALLFSLVNVAMRSSVADVHPLVGASIMYGLGGAVLAPVLMGFRVPRGALGGRLLAMTLLGGALAPVALFLAFSVGATAATASLLVPLELVFTAALAALFLRERLDRWEGAAFALLVGAALVIGVAGASARVAITGAPLLGIALVVLANLSWAGDNVVSAPLTRRVPIPQLIAVKTLGGAALVAGAAWAVGAPLTLTLPALLALAFAGVFGVAVSTLLFYGALRDIGATRTTLVFSTSALFGAIAGAVLLDEPLEAPHLLAGSLVALGLAALTWRVRRKETLISEAGA